MTKHGSCPPAGMSAGCIPVVLRRGGVEDIVSHGANGFLGADPTDLEQLTLGSFNMSADEAAAMRTQVQGRRWDRPGKLPVQVHAVLAD